MTGVLVSGDAQWFIGVAWLLAGAALCELLTGGMVRGISPFPKDSTFRSLSRATWWLSPSFVVAAAVGTAWGLLSQPLLAAPAAAIALCEAVLCWRWRPARADDLWIPTWLARMRSAVPVQIRDAAAWRRQLVGLLSGVAVVALATAGGQG